MEEGQSIEGESSDGARRSKGGRNEEAGDEWRKLADCFCSLARLSKEGGGRRK
jgi:hypothetical protein